MIQKNTLEDINNFMDALADVQERPYNIMSKVFGNKHGLNTGRRPKEDFNDEDPPIKIGKSTEIIQIDGTLGLYTPREDKITIFIQPIEQASNIFECNPKHLKIIVRLHEMAHAIINVGYVQRQLAEKMEDDEFRYLLESATENYDKINKKVNEHYAQHLTFYALILKRDGARNLTSRNVFGELINIFETLNSYQPHEYRIKTNQNIKKDTIFNRVKLIKRKLVHKNS